MTELTVLTPRITERIAVDPVTGCHNWTGGRNADGYGCVKIDGAQRYTHRLMYALFVGDLRAGMHIDHTCANRACCNPAHLEQVTPKENTRRGRSAVLDAAEVATIRARLLGGESVAAIARAYAVGDSTIRRIRDRLTWSEVAPVAA